MEMAPGAIVDDGSLDVIHINPMSRRRLLSCFPKIYKGSHISMDEVEHQTAKKIQFLDCPATDVMVDGEILRLKLESLTVIPSAIEVIH